MSREQADVIVGTGASETRTIVKSAERRACMRRHTIGLELLRPIVTVALGLFLLGVTTGAIYAQPAARASHPGHHVYLLRGLLNIFSLGLDDIGAKLQQRGINATVHNHLAWSALADEAAADYKAGRLRTIVIVGHSAGATAVTDMANRLGELGVPVKLAIGLDPVSNDTATGHVERYVNFYLSSGAGKQVARGSRFSGSIQNVDVKGMTDVGHMNIEKNLAMQQRVIALVQGAIGSSAPTARHAQTSETGSISGAAKH